MITKKKRKYVLIIVLLLAWGAGVLGFVRFEKYMEVKGQRIVMASVNPVMGVAREVPIPILLYHGIVKEDDGVNVTITNFKEQMIALRERGYTALDTKDLFGYYKQGAKLPEKPILITFDDGRKDSYLNGDAILKELGFKAVMFIVTDKQDSEDSFFLGWDELREMHASGTWDIEAHANKGHDAIQVDADGNVGNYGSNKMWIAEQNRLETDEEYKNRLSEDLRTVKNDLEMNIPGLHVISFAFPLGDYGQRTINMEKETAIKTYTEAVKSIYPLSFELNFRGSDFNNFDDSDSNLLRRYEVPSDISADALVQMLVESRVSKLPYAVSQFTSEELSNWFCNWGKVFVDNTCVTLASEESESGAEMVLYGGHYWKSYTLQTEISLESGNAYIIGRYVDDDNFAFCGISNNGIVFGEQVAGTNYELAYVNPHRSQNDYRIELQFVDNTVIGKLDDQPLFGPIPINPCLKRGGIGFQVWNSENGAARVSVYKVAISNQQTDKEGFFADPRP